MAGTGPVSNERAQSYFGISFRNSSTKVPQLPCSLTCPLEQLWYARSNAWNVELNGQRRFNPSARALPGSSAKGNRQSVISCVFMRPNGQGAQLRAARGPE